MRSGDLQRPNITRIIWRIKETKREEESSWPQSLQVGSKMSRIL
jgi:hypothetical protein